MIGRLLAAVAIAGCYRPPEPDCGFVCGPGDACPADYACASDHHCHRNGAPAELSCGASPVDAAVDSPIGPKVTTVLPTPGELDVVVNTPLLVLTDEEVQVYGPGILLFDGTTQLSGSVEPLAMGFSFTPDAQLAPHHHFMAQIASGTTNLAGAELAVFQWSFDTGSDNAAPSLQSAMPFPNELDVPVATGIRVRFDEPVTGIDATTFTVLDGTSPVVGTIAMLDARTFELRPASSLSHASIITVSLSSAIQDAYGNALDPAVSYVFMTQ